MAKRERTGVVRIGSRIVADPKIRFGRPVIVGTRVPIDVLVGGVAAGMSVESVAEEYGVTRRDVLAALKYAAKLVASEEIRAFGGS
jgi:uncharacterized protein (DUF433 family)